MAHRRHRCIPVCCTTATDCKTAATARYVVEEKDMLFDWCHCFAGFCCVVFFVSSIELQCSECSRCQCILLKFMVNHLKTYRKPSLKKSTMRIQHQRAFTPKDAKYTHTHTQSDACTKNTRVHSFNHFPRKQASSSASHLPFVYHVNIYIHMRASCVVVRVCKRRGVHVVLRSWYVMHANYVTSDFRVHYRISSQ